MTSSNNVSTLSCFDMDETSKWMRLPQQATGEIALSNNWANIATENEEPECSWIDPSSKIG